MTARYRCPFCGSFTTYYGGAAKRMREHILKTHRRALEIGLHPIEAFTTQGEAIAP